MLVFLRSSSSILLYDDDYTCRIVITPLNMIVPYVTVVSPVTASSCSSILYVSDAVAINTATINVNVLQQ